jgi:hypothetical protein
MCVDVKRKQCNVAHKAPNTKKGDQLVFSKKHMNKFGERIPGESCKVNNDEHQPGSDKAEHKA